MPGSKWSKNYGFTVSFLCLELGREHKENYMMVGESKVETDWITGYFNRWCAPSEGSEKEDYFGFSKVC